MPFQLLLNILLAFLWMFLANSFSTSSFIIGYLLGLLAMFAMRRGFSNRFYLGPFIALIRLFFRFLYELVVANLEVLSIILKPKLDIKPGIFAYETALEHNWQVTLLSMLITLTPGTLVVDISDDNKTLYIHALHMPEADEAVSSIRNSFEKAILEVSR
ncbi:MULTISPECIES: Na+/H+ antiporter subunit E [Exiguobacterium]|uniref:Na+/H+ antiporter subunit E n=3 Tax=Exiguobacterium antarcticum TaxID=132920 RepID=A0ABT6R5G0_9BACL|nr:MULTISPECIES: Na+/H+ antiporter subunit E [Exiguobacterium]AFS70671.1 Na(+)/H(+) antiporter subunit E [Exiguobacterium antarcticum B7]MDI3236196.1 Na+/H+ antiporter subunit E [Exiguobacterium antarcticum]